MANINEDWTSIRQAVEESEFVLVGLGEEWAYRSPEQKQQLMAAYDTLAKLLKGKTYFVVSINEDELVYASPLLDFFITAPYTKRGESAEGEQSWQSYMNWLPGTLGHRLCILELGVGLSNPQIIRWPFEKCAQINQKAKLIRVHHTLAFLPEGVGDRGISIKENAVNLFAEGKDKA